MLKKKYSIFKPLYIFYFFFSFFLPLRKTSSLENIKIKIQLNNLFLMNCELNIVAEKKNFYKCFIIVMVQEQSVFKAN